MEHTTDTTSRPERIVYKSRDWTAVLALEEAERLAAEPAETVFEARKRVLALDENLTIRLAGPEDERAVRRLAALDSYSIGPGEALGDVLLAEVGDELWAAMSLDGGPAVGDPFRPTRALLTLLAQRAHQFERADRWPRSHRARRLRRDRSRPAASVSRG